MATSELHEKILKDYLKDLEKKGYKVLDLERKSPDGIAIKNNEIFAVEVLGRQYKKGRGWKNKFTYKNKEANYHMFDGLLIKTFKYPIDK